MFDVLKAKFGGLSKKLDTWTEGLKNRFNSWNSNRFKEIQERLEEVKKRAAELPERERLAQEAFGKDGFKYQGAGRVINGQTPVKVDTENKGIFQIIWEYIYKIILEPIATFFKWIWSGVEYAYNKIVSGLNLQIGNYTVKTYLIWAIIVCIAIYACYLLIKYIMKRMKRQKIKESYIRRYNNINFFESDISYARRVKDKFLEYAEKGKEWIKTHRSKSFWLGLNAFNLINVAASHYDFVSNGLKQFGSVQNGSMDSLFSSINKIASEAISNGANSSKNVIVQICEIIIHLFGAAVVSVAGLFKWAYNAFSSLFDPNYTGIDGASKFNLGITLAILCAVTLAILYKVVKILYKKYRRNRETIA